jgi:hypothetical protein
MRQEALDLKRVFTCAVYFVDFSWLEVSRQSSVAFTHE